jgi:hypothetical protein
MANDLLALSIEHSQQIHVAADGTATRGDETYIREYVGMLDSGLMARLSNAAYKTLHALALRARILGDPRRSGAEEEFRELVSLGIVSNEDKGLLFCFPSRERLMQDTGIGSAHTIDAAMLELSALNLLRRITPTQPRLGRGHFGSNVYIIHPESFIGKFGTGDGEQKLPPVNGDGEQKVPPVSKPTEGSFCTLKNNNKGNQQEEQHQQLVATIADCFARAIGTERYEPSEREYQQLVSFLAEGYACEKICEIVQQIVTREQAKGKRVRSLAYCFPAIRDPRSRHHTASQTRTAEQEAERDAVSRAPQPSAVQGLPPAEAPTVTSTVMDLLAEGDTELRDLLEIVQERNPGRALQKSDVRAWQAVAQRFRDLAKVRDTTPIGLVMQAVLKAIGAHSDRDGFFAPRLAETILEEWQREEAEKERAAEPIPDSPARNRAISQATAALPALQTADGPMTPDEIWNAARRELRGQMTRATFDTWVKATFVAEAQDGEKPMLVIGTRNPYAVEWLEHRLHTTIQRTVCGIVGKNVTVKFSAVVG